MKSSFLIAGALTLILASGTLLLPGCGGGGSSSGSTDELRFGRQKDIQFLDFPQYRGILTIRFADQAAFPTRAAGTLQVVDATNPKPATENPIGFTVALPPGTYILTGNALDGTNGFDYDLDVNGSYQGGPKFRLTGNFDDDGLISISAPFKAGDSVLRGRVVPPMVVSPTPTSGGTTAGGITGTTTAGTTAGTTTGATTAGNTTAGGTTTGLTAGGTTGTTTSGGSTAGAITAGSTLAGGGGTTNPPTLP